jgi:hypothetical protein
MKENKEGERQALKSVKRLEEIAGKKAGIYSRLLTDPTLAKTMESLEKRHQNRKETILNLLQEKTEEEANARGRYEMKGGESEDEA